jgi:protein-tyrosine phosphatase
VIKILFICHGNICRSAAAEMVLKQMAREQGIRGLRIASAAATREEIGNDIYPPMKRALQAAGYVCEPHAARQTVRADYGQWDHIVGMDDENMWDMKRIYGGDPEGKLSLLMDWAGKPGQEIDDPWYTRDFRGVLRQIEEGCRGIIQFIARNS